jgi:hypothetical protein
MPRLARLALHVAFGVTLLSCSATPTHYTEQATGPSPSPGGVLTFEVGVGSPGAPYEVNTTGVSETVTEVRAYTGYHAVLVVDVRTSNPRTLLRITQARPDDEQGDIEAADAVASLDRLPTDDVEAKIATVIAGLVHQVDPEDAHSGPPLEQVRAFLGNFSSTPRT